MARTKGTLLPLAIRTTFVYRAFGTRGELIYVGISQSWRLRIEGHRKRSSWWQFVRQVEVQQFSNRRDAFAMESWAIARETPLANTELQSRHVPSSPPTPDVSFGFIVFRVTPFGDHIIPPREVNLAHSEYQTGVLAV